jgi:hypothetical protein
MVDGVAQRLVVEVETSEGHVCNIVPAPVKNLWIRIRVTHVAGPSAADAEIVLLNVYECDGAVFCKPREAYLPLNLRWSYTHDATKFIPVGGFRFSDLGYLGADKQGKTTLVLTTVVQPIAHDVLPYVLPAGQYVLGLRLTGERVRPQDSLWKISWPETWSDDEASLLAGLSITRYLL